MSDRKSDTTVDAFEHAFSDHVGLARRILAAVPDAFTDTQLDGIGRRARHWVMKAFREFEWQTTKLREAAQEIDRLSLVIDSAVRHSDPSNGEAVAMALLRLRAALGVQNHG